LTCADDPCLKPRYNAELPRATLNVADAMVLIEPILEQVKNGNQSDLIALAQEFDGVTPTCNSNSTKRHLDEALWHN